MDELIKFIKEKYIEDIVSPLDLHKVVIFFVSLLALELLPSSSHKGESVWVALMYSNIYMVLDPTSKLWAGLIVLDLVLAISMTLSVSASYSKIKALSFQRLSSIQDINTYISNVTNRISRTFTGNVAVDLVLVKDISKDLPKRRKTLIGFHIFGEFFLAFSLISATSTVKGGLNAIDLAVFCISIIIVFILQWQAYLYYLEKVIPLALPEKFLRERKFTADSDYT
jgi:hypothetical protein